MSINLDLDFQEYTPTNSGRIRTIPQQPEVQVRIPLPTDNAAGLKQNIQNAKSVLNVLQNVASFQSTNQSSSGNTSDEALQQLLRLSDRQKNKQQRANSNSWGLGYLAQYFDVTTDDVLQRIIWSAIPIRKMGIDLDDLNDPELTASLANNPAGSGTISEEMNSRIYDRLNTKQKNYSYIERFIQSRPDFYGPFWVSTTLIFAVAIFSNIVSFKRYRAKMYQVDALETGHNLTHSINTNPIQTSLSSDQLEEWHYSMDELNMTASVVIFYVTLIPTFLWFLFWFRGCAKYYTLNETICAYGYSMSTFILLSILLMVQVTLFKLLAVIVLSSISSLVLVQSFLPIIRSDPNKSGSLIILLIVPVCHFGLAYILHRIMLQ